MQELRNKILEAVSGGKKAEYEPLINSLTPKEYNAFTGEYRRMRAEGLVHREVTVVDGKSQLFLVEGDHRTNKNKPQSKGE